MSPTPLLGQQVAMRVLVQAHRHAGVGVVPDADRRRQQAHGDRPHRGDLEFARLDLECRPGAAHGPLGGQHGGARLRQERLARRSEPDRAGQAPDQRAANLGLQRPHLL